MTDFNTARSNMIETQLRPNGVTDGRILAAIGQVQRELFVGADQHSVAYADSDVRTGNGRILPNILTLARMIQLAQPQSHERVLIIGGSTGYSAAVVSQIAAQTTILESEPELVRQAVMLLRDFANVSVQRGPLQDGWISGAPYDVILIEGRIGHLPVTLVNQLSDQGRIIAGCGESVAKLCVWTIVNGQSVVRQYPSIGIANLPGFEIARPAFEFA